ncbi:MAG: hypothetical protein DRI84_02945 [Bacteroidetes bacterium]|nr:MAG: hypothetical protein DRI84_02945 [Bacteroidota bacterium]
MTNKILYENYLKESGEIISIDEWLLTESKSKMKKMKGYWNALRRYGIVGLAAYAVGNVSTVNSATGGILSIPLGLIFYAGYKTNSEVCQDKCTTFMCSYKCHLKSCGLVIKEIYKAIGVVKTRPGDQRKVLKKLDKHLVKWVQRYTKYKRKIKYFKKQIKQDKKTLKQKSIAARARYYGGNV